MSNMNVTLNGVQQQISAKVGKNGILKFAVAGSQNIKFHELQGVLADKATNDAERAEALRLFQLSDEVVQQSLARTAKSRMFNLKAELANSGDMNARNEIIDLFSSFGLERFLTRNLNHNNNFVTNLVSMSPGERAAFLRLEEYILSRMS
ncbi:MAG: hypothetical protein FWB88_05990 [Defluviitaleaceae bacterium]|nr:hypothetical protein [Defluviitaleaceae bacterium]MCL2240141.1 hypothetical protein [Defluviitaleaceae bacterium]